MRIICPRCGETAEKAAGWVNASRRKGSSVYCSRECSTLARSCGTSITCLHCGSERRVPPSKIKAGMRYCSLRCARDGRRTTSQRRFEKYIDKEGPDGCWLWTGAVRGWGYGVFNAGAGNRSAEAAHRFAFELYVSPIPDGSFVLHKCDRPACCNPEHLFLGDAADNTADMIAKGRNKFIGFRGVKNGMAKLTDGDVRKIRQSAEDTRSLATRFGVSLLSIRRVRSGELWGHVT